MRHLYLLYVTTRGFVLWTTRKTMLIYLLCLIRLLDRKSVV